MAEIEKICPDNVNEKKRLHYIDVAKGILILMVVYGHLYAWTRKYNPEAADYVLQSINLFISFYMPAFFVITGFCSNFKKPFYDFLYSSFKSILLPGVTFAILDAVISFDVNLPRTYGLGKNILLFGGQYWFLTALFMARLMYWVLYNHFSRNKTMFFCVALFVIGFVIAPLYKYHEFWWFLHAMLLTPYLYLGQMLRHQKSIPFKFAAILFAVTLVVTVMLSNVGILQIEYVDADFVLKVPAIVQSFINMNYSMLMSLVLLSVTGSIMIVGLAKKIGTNALLEYLGKSSLVIYCVHGVILRKISHYVGECSLPAHQYFVVVLTIFFFTTILSCAIAYVFNRRYLKVLIGNF